jgi:hypothetical protein
MYVPYLIAADLPQLSQGDRTHIPMKNNTGRGFMIDEIRFLGYYDGVGTIIDRTAALNVSFAYRGTMPICPRFIPVSLFARRINDMSEGANAWFSSRLWRLPKPLYLAPGDQIDFQFYYLNNLVVPAGPARHSFALGGRLLDYAAKKPEYVDVPYFTHFQGAVHSSAYKKERSTSADLRNVTEGSVTISKMHYVISEGALGDVMGTNEVGTHRMKITDSRGNIFLRDMTPLSLVFDRFHRETQVGIDLPSNQFVIAELEGEPVTAQQVNIGLSGYRKVLATSVGI